jgi:oxygen-independent coproporphyrinogen-3 oxidase
MTAPEIVFDSDGGDEEEYLMLKLRLIDGVNYQEYSKKFSKPFPPEIIKKAQKFAENGLIFITDAGFRLTENGYLVSNSVISELIL